MTRVSLEANVKRHARKDVVIMVSAQSVHRGMLYAAASMVGLGTIAVSDHAKMDAVAMVPASAVFVSALRGFQERNVPCGRVIKHAVVMELAIRIPSNVTANQDLLAIIAKSNLNVPTSAVATAAVVSLRMIPGY